MLDQYFEMPRVLRAIESPAFTLYLDSFAQELDAIGFAREHVRNQIRGAAHLCTWAEKHGVPVGDFGEELVARFGRHLPRCQCPGPKRGRSEPVLGGALRVTEHLRRMDVLPSVIADPDDSRPVLLADFLGWMRQHRGVGEATLRQYEHQLTDLLERVGEDPSRFTADKIRCFLQQRSKVTVAAKKWATLSA